MKLSKILWLYLFASTMSIHTMQRLPFHNSTNDDESTQNNNRSIASMFNYGRPSAHRDVHPRNSAPTPIMPTISQIRADYTQARKANQKTLIAAASIIHQNYQKYKTDPAQLIELSNEVIEFCPANIASTFIKKGFLQFPEYPNDPKNHAQGHSFWNICRRLLNVYASSSNLPADPYQSAQRYNVQYITNHSTAQEARKFLISNPIAFSQSTNEEKNQADKKLALKIYTLGVKENDVELLELLRSQGAPIPDNKSLTDIMQEYALPNQYLHFKPKIEALTWCLQHGANPNGKRSYYSASMHPLQQILCFLRWETKDDSQEAFTLLKNAGAYYVHADPSNEFTTLTDYEANKYPIQEKHYIHQEKVEAALFLLSMDIYKNVVIHKITESNLNFYANKLIESAGRWSDHTCLAVAEALKDNVSLHTPPIVAILPNGSHLLAQRYNHLL